MSFEIYLNNVQSNTQLLITEHLANTNSTVTTQDLLQIYSDILLLLGRLYFFDVYTLVSTGKSTQLMPFH